MKDHPGPSRIGWAAFLIWLTVQEASSQQQQTSSGFGSYGSEDPYHVAPLEATLENRGRCTDWAFPTFMMEDCQSRAVQLGVGQTEAGWINIIEEADEQNPIGCYYDLQAKQVYFNTKGDPNNVDDTLKAICWPQSPDLSYFGQCTPSGYGMQEVVYALDNPTECQSAAAWLEEAGEITEMIGNVIVEREDYYPKGCYWNTNDSTVHYNYEGQSGSVDQERRAICAPRNVAPSEYHDSLFDIMSGVPFRRSDKELAMKSQEGEESGAPAFAGAGDAEHMNDPLFVHKGHSSEDESSEDSKAQDTNARYDTVVAENNLALCQRACGCRFIGRNTDITSQFLCQSPDGEVCFNLVTGWCAETEIVCEVPN